MEVVSRELWGRDHAAAGRHCPAAITLGREDKANEQCLTAQIASLLAMNWSQSEMLFALHGLR